MSRDIVVIARPEGPWQSFAPFAKSIHRSRDWVYLALFFAAQNRPKTIIISINPYYYRLNTILPILTLALFFQIAFS